jgi:large subunit ribosomal protein L31
LKPTTSRILPNIPERAMKANIHPDYHEINVVMTDGTTFKTRSTMGKVGDTLRLDIDPKTHPAWTGQQRMLDTGGQVAKFNKRFATIGLKVGPSGPSPVGKATAAPSAPKAAAPAAKPAAKKAAPAAKK